MVSLARGAALIWLGLAATPQSADASCSQVGSRCICVDSDGDNWDLSELAGDHQVSGPGSSIWTFECELTHTSPPPPHQLSLAAFRSFLRSPPPVSFDARANL